jgi:hypothetical protein
MKTLIIILVWILSTISSKLLVAKSFDEFKSQDNWSISGFYNVVGNYYFPFLISGIFHIPFAIAFASDIPENQIWNWSLASIPMLTWVYGVVRSVLSWGKNK